VKDCEWIANLLAHGLIRASFIPPPPIRDLRDLTRHRKSLIRDRVKATNREHKLLQCRQLLERLQADGSGDAPGPAETGKQKTAARGSIPATR